ncbi:hypothetical protein [Ferruginibacter sp. SUN106]|uniref:hypothetical protein n=1 Tax=Ferruginibacter sp. SUN106 TaxID=2978348 RepID=UPI003D36BAAD
MAEPQQPDTSNDFPDSSDNASFGGELLHSKSQSDDSKTETKKDEKKGCHTHPIITCKVERDNDDRPIIEARRANKFSKIGLFVNAFLLLCTLGALGFTWWGLIDARKKDIAQSERERFLDSLNRRKDSISYERDTATYNLNKRDIEERSKRDDDNLDLTRQSVEAQINSLQQSQTQFEKENKPYLDMLHISIEVDSIGNCSLVQEAFNVGKQPIKLIEHNAVISIFTEPKDPFVTDSIIRNIRFTRKSVPGPLKAYVASQSFRKFNSDLQEKIPSDDINKVRNGTYVAAVFEKITYINLITNKVAYCEIRAAINIFPNTDVVIIDEENYEDNKRYRK